MGSYGEREMEQDNFPEESEDSEEELVFPEITENTERETTNIDDVHAESSIVANEVNILGRTLPISDENVAHQTSNLIANPENEKRQKEGKRSGRKRTASAKEDYHQEKKRRGRPKGVQDKEPRKVYRKEDLDSLKEELQKLTYNVKQLKSEIQRQVGIIEKQAVTIESMDAQQQQMCGEIQCLKYQINYQQGFAAYQPLGNSCGTPIHQLLFADSNQQTVLNQLNFNNVPGTNQQQMSNITFPMNQQMQNLHPNHFISNAATTYNPLMFSSGFVSTQPQFNQYYQGPVSNSGHQINQVEQNLSDRGKTAEASERYRAIITSKLLTSNENQATVDRNLDELVFQFAKDS